VFAFPFAVFRAGLFGGRAGHRPHRGLHGLGLGTLGALATLRGAAMAEEAIWDRLNGRLIVSCLLLVAALTLLIAGRLYAAKEAGPGGSPLRMPLSWWGSLRCCCWPAWAWRCSSPGSPPTSAGCSEADRLRPTSPLTRAPRGRAAGRW
jgi:hypothetical protein